MWAPRLPVSFGSYPSTKHPTITDRRCSSVAAQPPRFSSSTSQRRKSGEEIGGLGHAVLNAFQSPSSSADSSGSKTLISADDLSKRERKIPKQGEQSIQKQRRQSQKEERELSGSEVLLALQKAGARRSQKLKPVKKKEGSAVDGGSRGGGEAVATDYSNVRQLNIKSDWGVRLEELERRLQEFINA